MPYSMYKCNPVFCTLLIFEGNGWPKDYQNGKEAFEDICTFFGSDKSADSRFMIHETASKRLSHILLTELVCMYTHTHTHTHNHAQPLILCKCTFTSLLLHSYHQSAFDK